MTPEKLKSVNEQLEVIQDELRLWEANNCKSDFAMIENGRGYYVMVDLKDEKTLKELAERKEHSSVESKDSRYTEGYLAGLCVGIAISCLGFCFYFMR